MEGLPKKFFGGEDTFHTNCVGLYPYSQGVGGGLTPPGAPQILQSTGGGENKKGGGTK